MTSDEKLQAIYDVEQNIVLSWLWDYGVEICIGDRIIGFNQGACFDTVKEAIDWAYEQVMNNRLNVTKDK